jgi:hypothetical protein
MAFTDSMVAIWIVITITHRDAGPPLKQHFLVAIADQAQAVEALRIRRKLPEADMMVVGEATTKFLERAGATDIEEAQIREIMAIE